MRTRVLGPLGRGGAAARRGAGPRERMLSPGPRQSGSFALILLCLGLRAEAEVKSISVAAGGVY